MELTSDNVQQTMRKCLFQDNEDTSKAVKISGIAATYGFNPDSLEKNKKDISDMLSQLPTQFHQGTGDGWSFLNACDDNKGNQWTGLHSVMDELFCLGLGIKRVRYLMPREMWTALPGGMPYLVVLKEEEKAS